MQLTTILTTALLSSVSLAGTFKTLSKSKPSPALTWNVTNFNTSCTSGDCTYNFHIAGQGTPNTPGFNTTCTGATGKEDYQPCGNEQISAIVDPAKSSSRWNVEVQHTWVKGEAQFWAVGSSNATAPAKRFNITVDEQYGVA
ncbi:uncharacterized protein EURHEDRAFT_409904 [Aspergillus ruber CBS 135680]|uniref:Uncharacterized protein n=1 Tax=Aspergillus ruber (strain CBS 135680) TaxID=1388766 RepID=A0A017SLM9_ASPRC|nr:uncharacterized protein EURHEDRAFT_409904 [Aspergillus ruber CBS 135680]EYE97671.1 hypothetical protein EURHEDRAFT_409904 [Aspergillus ruber CBS 135680]